MRMLILHWLWNGSKTPPIPKKINKLELLSLLNLEMWLFIMQRRFIGLAVTKIQIGTELLWQWYLNLALVSNQQSFEDYPQSVKPFIQQEFRLAEVAK